MRIYRYLSGEEVRTFRFRLCGGFQVLLQHKWWERSVLPQFRMRSSAFYDKATEYGYGGIDLRLSYRQKYLAAYHNQTATKGFDFNDRVNGKDTTVRLVIDTINKKYYGYSVLSNGEYEYEGEGVYELNQLSYFWFRSYNFTEKGDTITFKRVKMYEIEKNESSLIESEFAHFMNTVPDTFVHASGALVDPANVAEDITIPDQLVAEFTVETLRNAVITENGKIIRGLEDTIGNIKISNSGTGYSVNKISSSFTAWTTRVSNPV